jgi:elongation factor P
MINAQDIKIGTAIRMDGKLYFCIDFLHVKPGKGNTFMRTKLKDVVNGYVLERRFNIGEKLEDVRVERRPHQYLYMEGADYIFMNQETFDQIPIAHDLINGVDFLLEGMVVDVVSDASTETVLFADVPVKVQMKVTYTEPGLKGDTATNTLKPATVESGATVRVPLFINEGETIGIMLHHLLARNRRTVLHHYHFKVFIRLPCEAFQQLIHFIGAIINRYNKRISHKLLSFCRTKEHKKGGACNKFRLFI